MDVVGDVTAAAAGIAAVLSGVNLWISGRRELNRWTREALMETLVNFFDTSFKLRDSCRQLIVLTPGKESEIPQLRKDIVSAHDHETDTLTRLRLLAPSNVVRAAEILHEADHDVIDSYLAEAPAEQYREALAKNQAARGKFIDAARSAFNLKDSAPQSHSNDGTSWWKFRDDTAGLNSANSPAPSSSEPSSST